MSVKDDLNRLIVPSGKTGSLPEVKIRPSINKRAVTKRKTTSESSGGGGLGGDLTMRVVSTKTVIIPVPSGADEVEVEVVSSYTLTDSSGNSSKVTVIGYP